MFKLYGLVGLSLVFLSFLFNIFKIPTYGLSVNFLFVVGFWLFFDALDFKLNKTSILHKIKKKHILLIYLVLIGVLIGLFSDLFGIFFSGLWDWYFTGLPLWLQILSYGRIIIYGYGMPILMLYSAYRVFLKIIKTEIKEFGRRLLSRRIESKIFSYSGLIGTVLIAIPIVSLPFLSERFPSQLKIIFIALASLGLFLLLEYIEFKRHERSFLKDIFEGKWRYALAIVITAIVIGFVWEYLNILRPAWEYRNLPLMHITIAGIPIAILLMWIPFVIIYLSFYRAIFKGKDEVW